jgi:hypothetical protein
MGPLAARRRTAVAAGAVGVVIVLVACGEPAPDDAAGTAESSSSRGPLFDDVEQLTPASLPPGWDRCSGAPSTFEGASTQWWSQTFGPIVDNQCQPWITVTQMPPDDEVWDPRADLDGKIGDWDVLQWTDDEEGSRFLFTWAFEQNLLLQSCCDPAADTHLGDFAEQSLEGLREHPPPRCTAPASDLSRENLVTNLSGHDTRMFDTTGCPIRLDIVRMETFDSDHHCWSNMGVIKIGTPVGESTADTTPRLYVRDPDGLLYDPKVRRRLDLDTGLPAAARDTGYRQNEQSLWVDDADDSLVYVVVDPESVEAWPRYDGQLECA